MRSSSFPRSPLLRRMRASRLALAGLILLLAGSPAAAGELPGRGDEQAPTVELQILAINDLHGHIDSTFLFPGLPPLGRVDTLATYLRWLETEAENTVIVSAGDLIGGSPFLSALFHDEPTIEAANLLGLDFSAVGNHELDEGTAELLRMQSGGCHPTDGCLDGDGFAGAEFQFLAANMIDLETGFPLLPPVAIRTFQGVRVAFIGVALESTPSMVLPSAVAGLEFLDEAETVNALVPLLRQVGIEAIVVLIHDGGYQTLPGNMNTCNGLVGSIIDIVHRIDPAVDLFITGHSHGWYNCVIGGRPVTAADAEGRLFTRIVAELNRVTKDMTVRSVWNWGNFQVVPPAPDVTALIDRYEAIAAPIGNRVLGTITSDITRQRTAAGESALGDLVADALLGATAAPDQGGAEIAFINNGGLRADLLFASGGPEADGEVLYREAFAVLPFDDHLVTMTLTGAQIDTLLELQFLGAGGLQVSEGFSYAWSASAPPGSKVDPATLRLGGVPVDPAGEYRVTVSDFLAEGGGDFDPVLLVGTDRHQGPGDLEALDAWLAAHSPVAPGPLDRIVRVP